MAGSMDPTDFRSLTGVDGTYRLYVLRNPLQSVELLNADAHPIKLPTLQIQRGKPMDRIESPLFMTSMV
jgi:hypothetical protein